MRMRMMVRKVKEKRMMIGSGGYGGSYMDDVDEEIILDGAVAPPTLQPVVEEFICHRHQCIFTINSNNRNRWL
jgi:hypothetical protein